MKRPLLIIIIILIVFVPIGLIIFALIGPRSQPITNSALFGKYSIVLPDGGKETLNLLPNGKCEQNIFLKDGKIYNAIGEWKYIKLNSWDYLRLEGTHISTQFGNKINPNIEQIPKGGTGGLPISRTLMGHIIIDKDESHYFKKDDR